MRHLWSARNYFKNNNMISESLVCSLEWLDLALEEVSETAPNMEDRIKNAAPRESAGSTWVPSNSKDVIEIVEELIPILTQDISGENRNDIGLIIDSSNILGVEKWKEILISRINEIQDLKVLEALQS